MTPQQSPFLARTASAHEAAATTFASEAATLVSNIHYLSCLAASFAAAAVSPAQGDLEVIREVNQLVLQAVERLRQG